MDLAGLIVLAQMVSLLMRIEGGDHVFRDRGNHLGDGGHSPKAERERSAQKAIGASRRIGLLGFWGHCHEWPAGWRRGLAVFQSTGLL